ncbi:ankyrin [Penicillium herquei]|nr:ankyrin [Penicillium herquei]
MDAISLNKIPSDIALCIADHLDQKKDVLAFLKTTRTLYPALAHYTIFRYRQLAFQYAVHRGRPDILERVIHMSLDVNKGFRPDFETPICSALMKLDKRTVELLLTKPDLMLHRPERGMRLMTPLQFMTWAENESMMEALLSHQGMDIKTASAALWTALDRRSLPMMKLLLRHNVDPNIPRNGNFLLRIAYSTRLFKAFDLLIEDERVDLSRRWYTESTPNPIFHRWMKSFSMERLTHMWHHRARIMCLADFDQVDRSGNNALHVAVDRGHVDWSQCLFERFPEMAQHSNYRLKTPISMAIAKKDAFCDFLVQTHPTVFLVRNGQGESPISEIVQREDLDLFQRLYSNLGDSIFDLKDRHGDCPIIQAATYGSNRMVTGLIRLGADPNVTDGDGLTPLMIAARDNNINLANTLLRFRKRVDFDRKDELGWTAYIWARWPRYRRRGQTSKAHTTMQRVLEAKGAGKGALDRVEKRRWPKRMWLSSSVRKSLV